jgi:hypothetical protein
VLQEWDRNAISSTLKVAGRTTAIAGSESAYRPECHTELSTDPSLQRPTFVEYCRRRCQEQAALLAQAADKATTTSATNEFE